MLDSKGLSILVVAFVGTAPTLRRGRGRGSRGCTGEDDVAVVSVVDSLEMSRAAVHDCTLGPVSATRSLSGSQLGAAEPVGAPGGVDDGAASEREGGRRGELENGHSKHIGKKLIGTHSEAGAGGDSESESTCTRFDIC